MKWLKENDLHSTGNGSKSIQMEPHKTKKLRKKKISKGIANRMEGKYISNWVAKKRYRTYQQLKPSTTIQSNPMGEGLQQTVLRNRNINGQDVCEPANKEMQSTLSECLESKTQ